ncbi:hypothetical protein DXA21_22985 [Parabacteroides distasonis]|nr:hypothetical protein DXA21_22985 [Parabacteroides distasonis]
MELVKAFKKINREDTKLLVVGKSWFGEENVKDEYTCKVQKEAEKVRNKIIFTVVGKSWFGEENVKDEYTCKVQKEAEKVRNKIIFTGFVNPDKNAFNVSNCRLFSGAFYLGRTIWSGGFGRNGIRTSFDCGAFYLGRTIWSGGFGRNGIRTSFDCY